MIKSELMQATIAELIGTFILVFAGCLSVSVAIQVAVTGGAVLGVLIAAMGHGFALVGIAYAFGNVSGAHVNPAVTLGLLLGGKVKINTAIYYWIAQFIGAILAAFVVRQVIPADVNVGETLGVLTFSNVGGAAIIEFVLTFLFVTVIYQSAGYGKGGANAGLAIGLSLAGFIAAGGVYSGASLNPARTFGPALFGGGDMSYVLPYMIAIFLGGALAGLFNGYVLVTDKK
jgi:aquaporin Z